ncbi:MAG: SRPBCC family protein, partial [Terracidiphilus sp.]
FKMSTPSDREIQVTRVFDAPRALVFEAFTKPELVKRWLLGPPGWSMPVCEIDLKVGGAYRYVWQNDSDGREMGLEGVFREIVSPKLLVATENPSWHSSEALDTTTFVEEGDATRMTITVLYQSTEVRDAALKSGMDRGMAMSYDRLEELMSSIIAA